MPVTRSPSKSATTLLLADDDKALCDLLVDYLQLDNYQCHCVHRGDEVIPELLRRQTDLLILDIMLPGDQGLEVLRKMRDQGSGAPPAELDKLFLPFYRVDTSRQRDSGGYGLGLSICKRVVESHSGTICARHLEPGLEGLITLPASLRVSPSLD